MEEELQKGESNEIRKLAKEHNIGKLSELCLKYSDSKNQAMINLLNSEVQVNVLELSDLSFDEIIKFFK